MKTVQKRYAHKYFDKIINIRVYSLRNGFNAEPCTIDAIKWELENLPFKKMQIDINKKIGKVGVHSNCWYEFNLRD